MQAPLTRDHTTMFPLHRATVLELIRPFRSRKIPSISVAAQEPLLSFISGGPSEPSGSLAPFCNYASSPLLALVPLLKFHAIEPRTARPSNGVQSQKSMPPRATGSAMGEVWFHLSIWSTGRAEPRQSTCQLEGGFSPSPAAPTSSTTMFSHASGHESQPPNHVFGTAAGPPPPFTNQRVRDVHFW